jgi:hypothetical protein
MPTIDIYHFENWIKMLRSLSANRRAKLKIISKLGSGSENMENHFNRAVIKIPILNTSNFLIPIRSS